MWSRRLQISLGGVSEIQKWSKLASNGCLREHVLLLHGSKAHWQSVSKIPKAAQLIRGKVQVSQELLVLE